MPRNGWGFQNPFLDVPIVAAGEGDDQAGAAVCHDFFADYAGDRAKRFPNDISYRSVRAGIFPDFDCGGWFGGGLC
jgi:hypothetical protein